MVIKDASLEIIATRRSQYPEDGKPEFLLVGRSNVGKSSFINTLLERKNLAYTSSRPGKTQTLNFYEVNHEFYLIDVPGYGYAEVSRSVQEKFGKMIEEYLETRKELKRATNGRGCCCMLRTEAMASAARPAQQAAVSEFAFLESKLNFVIYFEN